MRGETKKAQNLWIYSVAEKIVSQGEKVSKI